MSTTRIVAELPAKEPAGATVTFPKSLIDPWYWLMYGGIFFGIALLIHAHLHGVFIAPITRAAESHHWARVLVFPSVLWLVMGTLLLIFRTVAWMCYRPFPHVDPETAPSLTVVIPAYNEGPMVLKSIESVVRARYPRDRLEVYVVDDGSHDNTWEYIEQAARQWPDVVHPVRFTKNRGKRAALAAGFEAARGDVIVTIDSDSTLEPESLLAIAGPFRDPKVGAVAGKVAAYNRNEGLLPRMLHVRYILSFDVLRAVESTYRTVYCCPGALTAYRAAVVRAVVEPWKKQRFLGAQCTFGEDRALTNWILASGYHTVYQRAAEVRTLVPTTYRQLCKMFLRWDRSYVREEIRFMKIVWKRPPLYAALALWDRLTSNLRFPVSYASLVLLAVLTREDPLILLRFLLAMGIASLFYALYYLRSERSPAFLYGVLFTYFDAFLLFWILPYAAMTVRARSWLTR
ncbi:MAG TPA: glycosyltransferase [Candidatus Dormibacteraeota bacterium]|nr:glycosyltransferase [Candidatus Dormibacteraeota bacterium]